MNNVEHKEITLIEVTNNAIAFKQRWKGENRERGEAQTFWNELFAIFGKDRKEYAEFERKIKFSPDSKSYKRIDLLWPGKLIVEQKSLGENLIDAENQALKYYFSLRHDEQPRYIITSDFDKFRIIDLFESDKRKSEIKFNLEQINVEENLSFLKQIFIETEEEIRIKRDALSAKAIEYVIEFHKFIKTKINEEDSNLLIARLIYCLYAEDSGIFKEHAFRKYIDSKKADSIYTSAYYDSYSISYINDVFDALNTTSEKRHVNTSEILRKLPYISGNLFSKRIEMPQLNSKAIKLFNDCLNFDWTIIEIEIYGHMYETLLESKSDDERRKSGIHYTHRENIMKLINGLFLDELKKEIQEHKNDKKYLEEILNRISNMRFLDPACGCGNFLVITYEQLRELEREIYKLLDYKNQYDKETLKKIFDKGIKADNFYGIEIDNMASNLALTSLWIKDHDMNIKLSNDFDVNYERLPFKINVPKIVCDNAFSIDWNNIIPREKLNYIIGNPPFVGKYFHTEKQKNDMKTVCNKIDNHKSLDYVSAWFVKASEFIKGTKIKVAFVATKSITQGEQVNILWKYLNENGIYIHFAHRPFKWEGDALVYVVIIGFAHFNSTDKIIYTYKSDTTKELEKINVKNINGFLMDYENIFIVRSGKPISSIPKCEKGNTFNDNNEFLFTESEKNEFLLKEPKASKFMKNIICAHQFLNGKSRYCLWLKDAKEHEINEMPFVLDKIKNVREFRLNSANEEIRKKASFPSIFHRIKQPYKGNYIFIPLVMSHKKDYIPIGFFSTEYIIGTDVFVDNASLYHFGVLSSIMHMLWTKNFCTTMGTSLSYSITTVYNNFIWPENPSDKDKVNIEKLSNEILIIREKYSTLTLTKLYNPLIMPKDLLQAHQKLDKAVESLYRVEPFSSDDERLRFLLELYKNKTAHLTE